MFLLLFEKFRLAFVAALLIVLCACSVLNGANSATTVAVNGGIQLITSFYIQKKGNNDPATEAQVASQLTQIAQQLQALVSGNLTVAQFNAAIAPAIQKLSPPQQILAQELLVVVDAYFQQLVSTSGSLLTQTTQVAANLVLNDIITACKFYQTAPSFKSFHAFNLERQLERRYLVSAQ